MGGACARTKDMALCELAEKATVPPASVPGEKLAKARGIKVKRLLLDVLKRLARPRCPACGAPRMTTRRQAVRKPLQRAAARRPPEHVTTNQIVAWLSERLARIPASP